MRPPNPADLRPRRKFGRPRRRSGSPPEGAVSILAGSLAVACAISACSTTRPIQPLAPGETALGVSLGGPLLQTLGTVFPTPILSVGVAHGHAPNRLSLGAPWALTGAIDVTAALFGSLHVDPGLALYPLVRSQGAVPTVGLFCNLHVIANREDVLLAPQVAGITSWRLGRPWLLYVGLDAARPVKAQASWLAGPMLGTQWDRGQTRFGLEAKWIAPYHDVEPVAPSWISPAHHGFFSLLLSVGYRFGGAP